MADTNRATGSLPPIPAIVLIVAAAALVAAAATGVGMLLPPLPMGAGWMRALRVLGGLVLAAGVAGLIWQRGRIPASEDRRHDPTVAALVAAGSLMTALFVLALLAPRPPVEATVADESGAAAEEQGAYEEPATGDGGADRRGEALPGGFGMGAAREGGGGIGVLPEITAEAEDDGVLPIVLEWLRRIALALLLAAVVILAFMALSGRLSMRPREREPEPPVAAADAEAGLEASLTELGYEGDDPRRRITAAYHRLLAALADAGAPRAPQEAPHEHLHRALGPLGVRPEPMHRLTELYVAAQFSEHPITERHRSGAVEALEQALSELRSRQRNASVGTEGGGALPEAAPA